jgi:hypothetical protein
MDEDDDGRLRYRLRGPGSASKSWRTRIGDVLAHPAALLILGFTLTGVVGATLTHRWQIHLWERQQQHDWDQHLLREKYAIIDQLTQSVGDDMAAARDIDDIIFGCWPEDQQRTRIQRRIDDWDKARRTWRAKSMMLGNRVDIYFKDPSALTMLTDIIETVHDMEQDLKNIVKRLEDPHMPEPDPRKPRPNVLAGLAGESMDLINEVEAKVPILRKRLEDDLNQLATPAPAGPWPKFLKLPPPKVCTGSPPAPASIQASPSRPPALLVAPPRSP